MSYLCHFEAQIFNQRNTIIAGQMFRMVDSFFIPI